MSRLRVKRLSLWLSWYSEECLFVCARVADLLEAKKSPKRKSSKIRQKEMLYGKVRNLQRKSPKVAKGKVLKTGFAKSPKGEMHRRPKKKNGNHFSQLSNSVWT